MQQTAVRKYRVKSRLVNAKGQTYFDVMGEYEQSEIGKLLQQTFCKHEFRDGFSCDHCGVEVKTHPDK